MELSNEPNIAQQSSSEFSHSAAALPEHQTATSSSSSSHNHQYPLLLIPSYQRPPQPRNRPLSDPRTYISRRIGESEKRRRRYPVHTYSSDDDGTRWWWWWAKSFVAAYVCTFPPSPHPFHAWIKRARHGRRWGLLFLFEG